MRMDQLISNHGQTPDPTLVSKSAFFAWYGMSTVFRGLRLAGAGATAAYAGQVLAALLVTNAAWRETAAPACQERHTCGSDTYRRALYSELRSCRLRLYLALAGCFAKRGSSLRVFILTATLAITLVYGADGHARPYWTIPLMACSAVCHEALWRPGHLSAVRKTSRQKLPSGCTRAFLRPSCREGKRRGAQSGSRLWMGCAVSAR